MNSLSLIPFDSKLLPDFVALNRQWIEEHFTLEAMDLLQLENPYDSILDPEKRGFRRVPCPSHSEYARCNIEMELDLLSQTGDYA